MVAKRLEGRDEEILEPDIPIIDAHHHLFQRPQLKYMLEDYLDDAGAGHNIVATVYAEIQAFARPDGPEILRPLGEIEFANGVGAMCDSGTLGRCHVAAAIVGYADLRHGAAIGEFFDQAMALAPRRFRGIRQITIEHSSEVPFKYMTHRPPVGVLAHEQFRSGFKELAQRGLTFDAAVFHHQMPAIAKLASDFPHTIIALNHIGMAMGMEMDEPDRQTVYGEWSATLRELALRGNVVCKIGGLGMPFWGFGFENREGPIGYRELATAWRPYVETAIEVFGANRCMMESNFPPDARSCGFVPLWNALKYIVKDYSPSEKSALFHGTAARVYSIDLPST